MSLVRLHDHLNPRPAECLSGRMLCRPTRGATFTVTQVVSSCVVGVVRVRSDELQTCNTGLSTLVYDCFCKVTISRNNFK